MLSLIKIYQVKYVFPHSVIAFPIDLMSWRKSAVEIFDNYFEFQCLQFQIEHLILIILPHPNKNWKKVFSPQ